jgi:hypothetical protein
MSNVSPFLITCAWGADIRRGKKGSDGFRRERGGVLDTHLSIRFGAGVRITDARSIVAGWFKKDTKNKKKHGPLLEHVVGISTECLLAIWHALLAA